MESELQDEAEGSRSKRPRCEPVQAELVANSSNFVQEQIKALYVANHEFGDDVVRRTTTIVGLENGLQLLLEDCKVCPVRVCALSAACLPPFRIAWSAQLVSLRSDSRLNRCASGASSAG
jgi:hypothetical protein